MKNKLFQGIFVGIPLIVQMYVNIYIPFKLNRIALSIFIDQFEFIYQSKCVSCEMRYTTAEKVDMIFVYGECRQIMREVRLYTERFPDHIQETGSVDTKKTQTN